MMAKKKSGKTVKLKLTKDDWLDILIDSVAMALKRNKKRIIEAEFKADKHKITDEDIFVINIIMKKPKEAK